MARGQQFDDPCLEDFTYFNKTLAVEKLETKIKTQQ